ncbi:MAG: permease [Acidimicrobiales bacterium]
MIDAAIVSPLVEVGRGLKETAYMFWETLWALVLGFSLSGFVQAFVPRSRMLAKLGNHRPAAVGRAAFYGVVSSSCSYAASAMAKSLFAKGADFVAAMVFMIASTNLVVELGIVILVLLGWQFLVAEFVGGPLMIVLIAFAGSFVLSEPLVEAARRRLLGPEREAAGQNSPPGVPAEGHEPGTTAWSAILRSPAALSDAASYAVADVTMLRRELAIGFAAAGFLAVLVPTAAWNVLFVHGHGIWTVLENALVGPLIAMASFVCSIGNVPLAAALWSGGISFGGVVSFIFADLVAMPLILIYRKYYGLRLTMRLAGLLYAAMVVAGLVTEGIFGLLGAIPSARTIHVTSARFAWNYTTDLDIVFCGVAVAVWWLARNRERLGGGHGYVIDPVCGMQVRTREAPERVTFRSKPYWFCSDRCRERFVENPARYAATDHRHGKPQYFREVAVSLTGRTNAVDPVCGMAVDPESAAAHRVFGGVDYWFCNPGCATAFDGDTTRYAATSVPDERPC